MNDYNSDFNNNENPYFNRLHEQPVPEETMEERQEEAAASLDFEDSTYHYSYVKPEPEAQEYRFAEEPPRKRKKKRKISDRWRPVREKKKERRI